MTKKYRDCDYLASEVVNKTEQFLCNKTNLLVSPAICRECVSFEKPADREEKLRQKEYI